MIALQFFYSIPYEMNLQNDSHTNIYPTYQILSQRAFFVRESGTQDDANSTLQLSQTIPLKPFNRKKLVIFYIQSQIWNLCSTAPHHLMFAVMARRRPLNRRNVGSLVLISSLRIVNKRLFSTIFPCLNKNPCSQLRSGMALPTKQIQAIWELIVIRQPQYMVPF